jgi:protein-L-isoaspartate O-methyltransferase
MRSRIEQRRRFIANVSSTYAFAHASTPHGAARWPIEQPPETPGPISGRWLAHTASVPERWGVFLHLCADDPAARTILELGSSVGISGAYLASGRGCRRLITIEGSSSLAEVATATLEVVTDAAEVIVGPFDDGLTQAFARLDSAADGLDLVYIDGHHDEAATLNYAQRILPRLRPGGLVIFDDIYLYEEMWRAWSRLRILPGASAAVNVGRFGILVWAGSDSRAIEFDLSRYTGRWRVGGSRARATLPGA